MWIDEFDKAYEEGTMFLLTMHPHISGHRSRIVALEQLIAHIQAEGAREGVVRDAWRGRGVRAEARRSWASRSRGAGRRATDLVRPLAGKSKGA